MKNISIKDSKLIWHPYTQMKIAGFAIPIVSGEGATLIDAEGNCYIDAISSWWVNLHGHSHPFIAEKVYEQMQTLEHVIFAGFTHPVAVNLAEKLLESLPTNQAKVFFSDNGSTAVEVALKMAIQYWYNQGIEKRTIVALENAYHGDTFGAMSVSARSVFTRPFFPYLFDVFHIPVPVPENEDKTLSVLADILEKKDVAAFIFEPLLQGAAGMVIYNAKILDKILELCQSHNVITIADEVLTGFGRTGRYFAVDYLSIKPDIICLSKGLTGGTLPMGVTTCTQSIYEAFLSDDKMKTFFHGHSYTANPIGCAAALASLELLNKPECWENIYRIESHHKNFLHHFSKHSHVKDMRLIGTILAIEIKTTGHTSYLNPIKDQLYSFFLEHRVLLRPLGNIVYILPPYCITDEQLNRVYMVIQKALDSL